jgi:SCO1/SenC
MSALRIIRVAAVAAIAALVTAVVVFSLLPPPAKQQAESVPIGGPFELVDHDGIKVTDKTFAGKPSVIFFGYTSCPDEAQKVFAEWKGVVDRIFFPDKSGQIADVARLTLVVLSPNHAATDKATRSFVDNSTKEHGSPARAFKSYAMTRGKCSLLSAL